ncbi:MAG: helix-turn-helix transcriptional regulator [Saprospiraceae bacterium]|jgi:putative transcriptional regulator|nr:helix-turn-helix transcriptional regulator [Saprospiraceae bacterium]
MKNKVKINRQMHEWSQEELGRRVGVSRQTIYAIEQGNYAPSAVLALKIAAVLETNIDQIFELEDTDWEN